MKVLIAGSGAMGSCFGHLLHKGGHDVTLCDKWTLNIQTVQQRGLLITDIDQVEQSPLKMYYPHEVEDKDFDLIVFFTKSMQLEDMIQSVQHLVKPHTKVLCLLNGLGHYQTLKRYFDDRHILMGVTVVTAKLLGPAEFLISSHSPTEIHPMDPNEDEACERVIQAFNQSHLPFVYAKDIMHSTWRKAVLNGTANSICALLDINMKTLGDIPDSKELVTQIVTEFSMAAALEGVALDIPSVANYAYTFLTPEFAGCMHYPSMWQDLVAHRRPTEIDYINGYVARLCKQNGLNAPYCELITLLIHGKEKALGII